MEFKTLGIANNFLGLEEEFANFEKAQIVIQSLPYEHTSSYQSGSSKGPEEILKASHFVEFYDEEIDKEISYEKGICTLESLDFGGKVNADAIELIRQSTAALLNENKFVVSLGAEHTVTYGIVKAFTEKYKNLSVLQIDAHSDLREAYNDNPYSHASVMKRVFDLGIPISQVGIRAQCKEEAELIKNNASIHTIYAHQRQGDWMNRAVEHLTEEVYITVDIDGFDPSIMPDVGTPEPNGMLWQEVIDLFKIVSKSGKRVVGIDFVEILPKEGEIITQYNTAKLVYKSLGIFL